MLGAKSRLLRMVQHFPMNFAGSCEPCHGREPQYCYEDLDTLFTLTPNTSKQNQFVKWVATLNCHSHALSVRIPGIT